MVMFFGTFSLSVVCHPGPVHEDNRVGLAGNIAADFGQVQLHGFGVGARQHNGSALAFCGADGAEQVGIFVTVGPQGCRGRVPLRAQIRVRPFFWPMRASSCHQISSGFLSGNLARWAFNTKRYWL